MVLVDIVARKRADSNLPPFLQKLTLGGRDELISRLRHTSIKQIHFEEIFWFLFEN